MEHRYFITQPEIANLIGVKNQAIAVQAGNLGLHGFPYANRTAYSPSNVRRILEHRGFSYPKGVLSFQMLKGGSTKTSSAFSLAVRLNQYGARVLVIDADAQGNLSSALGYEMTGEETVLAHLLAEEAKIQDSVVHLNEGLDLIPSNYDNSMIDLIIQQNHINIKDGIADLIAPIRDQYDFVIFDCNPALSALNISIAFASSLVIIPVNPDPFSKQGLEKVLSEFERMSRSYKHQIDYKLLFTLYDSREVKTSQKYMIEYGSKYEDRMFATFVKRNVDVKTAIDQKKTIFDFRKATARADYDALALEILDFPINKAVSGNA